MEPEATKKPAEKKPATKPAAKARKSKPGKLTLEQAQAAAKENLGSNSGPSIDAVVNYLSKPKNTGKLFSPDEIAVGVGNGATGGQVRRALQRKGLASTKGKQPCIQHGKRFVYLSKEGNRNRYRAVAVGSK